MRERTRQSASGVTSYLYSAQHSKLLVPAAGTLYVADVPADLNAKGVLPLPLREVNPALNAQNAKEEEYRLCFFPLSLALASVFFHSLALSVLCVCSGALMDAKFSPDSALVAYARNNDLFVIDPKTSTEQRLTHANRASACHPLSCLLSMHEFVLTFARPLFSLQRM